MQIEQEMLVGRDEESKKLESFLEDHVRNKTSGSVYLSGAPGTGKTATVKHVLKKVVGRHLDCKSDYLNCMCVSSVANAYKLIFEKTRYLDGDFSLKNKSRKVDTDVIDKESGTLSSRQLINKIQHCFTSLDFSFILILDEIDQLETKDHAVLYRAFGWTELLSSKLILIGIANSLDLTERLLPKLKLSHPPQVIQFCPYQKGQVAEILKHRLWNEKACLDEKAVELCARKVSAMTGDIRKALGICQILLDKDRLRKSELKEGARIDSVSACRDVLEAVNTMYGSPITRSAISLPLQSKLMLAAILSLTSKGCHILTIDKICTAYKSACKVQGVPPVSKMETKWLCDVLSDHGLIRLQKSSTANRHKAEPFTSVQLLVDSKSLRRSLNDEAMIKNVLSAVS